MIYDLDKVYIVCDDSSYYGVYGCDLEDEIKKTGVELYSSTGWDDWSDALENKITALNNVRRTYMYR